MRQRYDWTWHTFALTKVLVQLPKFLQPEKPILLQIGELDPLFMLSGLLGAQEAGLRLQAYAMDGEESTLQTVWQQSTLPKSPAQSLLPSARGAVREHLLQKGNLLHILALLTQVALQAHSKGLLQKVNPKRSPTIL